MNLESLFGNVFDRIYVINLPERKDRRREIADQLLQVGLSLDSPIVTLFEAVRPAEKGEWETIGARGCFMSHLTILRQAHQDGVQSLLILEDDANWSRAFLANPKQFLQLLADRNWNFFDCGGPIYDGSIRPPTVTEVDSDQGITTTHCIGLCGEAIGLAAAYLHQITLRKFGDQLGGPMHVDGAYTWFRRENPNVKTLSFSPTMAYQRASASNIGEQRLLDRVPALALPLRLYRRIKNKVRG